MELRKGDTVLILAGKDKGKQGTIERVLRAKRQVVVGGINLMKRHLKPSSKHPSGGIIDLAAPMHQSKIKVITDEAEKPARAKKPAKKE